MKNHFSKLLILTLVILFSCNSQKKSKEVASYEYEEEKVEMSAELKSKVPDWVVEGKICYGLIVQIDKDKNPIKGKPIKAKVIQIQKDAIKMKALESVSLVEIEECTKMGLNRGDTWDEKDGDFYLTKEEAIKALKEKNLYKDKITID